MVTKTVLSQLNHFNENIQLGNNNISIEMQRNYVRDKFKYTQQ